jgi:hypothetical protein
MSATKPDAGAYAGALFSVAVLPIYLVALAAAVAVALLA